MVLGWETALELLLLLLLANPKPGTIVGGCKSSKWTANSVDVFRLWKSLDCVPKSLPPIGATWLDDTYKFGLRNTFLGQAHLPCVFFKPRPRCSFLKILYFSED